MELNPSVFKKIEAASWIIVICISLFYFWQVLVFLVACIIIRSIYIGMKGRKLEPIKTEGKAVVITGCDSGFGLGLAQRLYENGYIVFATCLNPDSEGGLQLKKINSDRMKVLALDVTNDDSVSRCFRLVKGECENTGLWGLVNNAGLNFHGDIELTTMSQFLEIGNINLYGAVRTTRAFLPLLRQTKGRLVNVTSVRGLMAVPNSAAYTMAKFGSEAFSDILRQEMNQFGISVSVIEPCNFGGATGCLNDAAIKRIKLQLDEQWNEASEDVKQIYGQAHMTQQLENCQKGATTTAPTIEPVIAAFEDALSSPCPRDQYLIPGSNSFFDIFHCLALAQPYMPKSLFDKVRAYFFPYKIYK